MTVFLRRAAGSAVAVLLGATTLAVVPALLMSAPARAQAPAEAPAHTARQRFDIAADDARGGRHVGRTVGVDDRRDDAAQHRDDKAEGEEVQPVS